MTAASLTVTLDRAINTAGPEELAAIESTAACLGAKYSLINRVCIAAQLLTARVVARKIEWRRHGYRIAKGQPGLGVYYKWSRSARDTTSDGHGDITATPQSAPPEIPGTHALLGDGATYVWDISQVVPLDCACKGVCTCSRPPAPLVTPAGADPDGFVELVSTIMQRAEIERGEVDLSRPRLCSRD
jgi:hypothetical protein